VGARVPIDGKASPKIVRGDAFEIDGGGLLHAVKAGTATVQFDTLNGTETIDYHAQDVDTVDSSCPGGGTPCLVSASWDIMIPFALFAGGKGGTRLVAGDLCPFAGPSVPFKCSQDFLEFTLQKGQTGTITANADPTVRLDFEGVTPDAIDGLQISFSPLPGGLSADARIVATKQGRAMNVDFFERHVTIDTPSVCGIDGAETDGISQGKVVGTGLATSGASASLWIYKKQAGTCAVSAMLVGTSITATGQYTF
jgi:hypothetical protein